MTKAQNLAMETLCILMTDFRFFSFCFIKKFSDSRNLGNSEVLVIL